MNREEVMAMSDEELRIKAAKLMGWYETEGDPVTDGIPMRVGGWIKEGAERFLPLPPDYPKDFAAAGELLMDMAIRRMFPKLYQNFDYGWYCEAVVGGPEDVVMCDDDILPSRAITRAFILAMAGDKLQQAAS